MTKAADGQEVLNGSADLDAKGGSQSLEGLEARFLQRCEVDLHLDDKISKQAMGLFKESEQLLLSTLGTIGTGTVEETERMWHACVLYAVKRLSIGWSPADARVEENFVGFTLSQILKATKLSLVEFFKELPQFLAKVGPKLEKSYGDDWEKRLMVKEVQTDFYYLTVLFNCYKRVYKHLFLPAEGVSGAESESSSEITEGARIALHTQFGWMLFLVLRLRVLNRFVDLVTYINGLLAIVIIMILHMPPSLRKFSFESDDFFKKRAEDGSVKVVASLCAWYHDASEEDVSIMVKKASSMIGDLFRKNSGFRTRSHARGIETDNLSYFEGLMDERSIASNLRIVENAYEVAYNTRGELDERMFIKGDDNLIGTLSSGTLTSSGTKRKFDSLSCPSQAATVSSGACPSSPSSPNSSPAKSNSVVINSRIPPPTPVSVTMSTVRWLRTYISPLPSQPTPELRDFFRSCDNDITANVTYRAQVLFEEIFSIYGAGKSRENRGAALLDGAWFKQRQLEATKLYYQVLTAMCKAEYQRLGNKNPTALLTNEQFHRCMIACSAELVLFTHKTFTVTFPAVLGPTGITAFDLSKVIESFVRHEEKLPRELKRHLNSMEQQILESMAWEKGSSMYNTLIVAKKHLAPVINRLCLLADPMPALDTLTQRMSGHVQREPEGPGANGVGDQAGNILSPLKERFTVFSSPAKSRLQPHLQSDFASPQRLSPLGGGETCAERVITVFFEKVIKLAAVRIKDLCERLHQPNQVREQIYRAMQHILYKETSLFFNRHIDQLILCSIYGVCKVNKANVTFKTCIEHYGKQPQCKRHVFCNVFIDSLQKGRGPERGDIIKFYNQVFVPATKQYLVQLGEATSAAAHISGPPKDEDQIESNGSGPRSPRQTFPALPDMSPKKVSATHNVYVSPLQQTKVRAIMSPRPGSLIAYVGESTHAYQSPAKDLTAINNQLNKRCCGRLDFNGTPMVSDSLVAGSLYPSARSATPHSLQLTTDSVLSSQSEPSWTKAVTLPPSTLKRPCAER